MNKLAAIESATQASTIIPTPTFRVGDKVHWYNGNDLYIGLVTITALAKPYEVWEPWCEHRYYVTPIDTPWYPLRESALLAETAMIDPPPKGTPRYRGARA